MTSVDDVIQPGQPIPDDVTEVRDGDGDVHVRAHDIEYGFDWSQGESLTTLHDWGPLTVTAVREQPAEPQRVETPAHGVVGQIITDLPIPGNVVRMHGRNSLGHEEDIVLVVEVGNDNASYWTAGHMECWNDEDIPRHYFPLTVNKVRAEPVPQQADASPLLDLVRQYGEESYQQGVAAGQRDEGSEDHYDDKARALLDRIAALVPQQPVQARSREGALLWQHTCASVVGISVTPTTPGPCADCPDKLGPWRPLLVGGDPAPERCGAEACNQPAGHDGLHDSRRVSASLRDRHEPHADGPREPSAQERADHELMAALGVEQIGEVIPAIEHLKALVDHLRNWRSEHDKRERERDEARAEVERLKAEVRSETETSDEYAGWASKLAHAAIERLDAPVTEEAHTELWELALNALEAPAAPPDPLVLSLPEVPEGTEALVGVRPGGGSLRFVRHPRFAGWINDDYPDPSETEPLNTGTVLDLFGPVRVELAPPREPRTWPKLADEPDVLPQLVQVADHGQWTLKNGRLYVSVGKLYDEAHNLAQLRMLGDVTEVTG